MTRILIDELVKYHLEHFDCFIPVFEQHVLDAFTLDCQLSDSLSYIEVIVPKDGKSGTAMLANKIKELGFSFTSFLSFDSSTFH